jgi:hypothetical protein
MKNLAASREVLHSRYDGVSPASTGMSLRNLRLDHRTRRFIGGEHVLDP